jgi:2-polyprenyl-3-methyl-5-hydroxy-6-metoxy-1,4-benzoquinol methylase
MTESHSVAPPSPFISSWVARLGAQGHHGLALDLASGRGRHALAMAAAGFRVVAIDIQLGSLVEARAVAHAAGMTVNAVCADLTTWPLPASAFALIVCTRYLDRTLVPALLHALSPGGVLLYETFTEHQLQHARGPRSPAHLLRPGELRTLVSGMEILFDEEVLEPDALARIAARRPSAAR